MSKAAIVFIFYVLCQQPVNAQNPLSYPADTMISKPELNFEILWHTFEDNYAFFKLRNIDWHKKYKDFRPLVNAQTTDDSLFNLFSKMLAPFHDNHINVIVPNVKQFKSVKPSAFAKEFSNDSLRNAFWSMVNTTLKNNGFGNMASIGPVYNGTKLFNYCKSTSVGYLRFNRCFADPDADSKPDAEVTSKVLDSLFTNFDGLKGLIVDVRDNIGGNDEFSFEVAGRFTGSKSLAMYKRTRKTRGGYEELGPAENWYLEPTGTHPFLKPVILLTNDKTVSAADVFAMIMKGLPRVTIIGENSRGIYSDMYGFTLPNQWLISLSNQRYYTPANICYEGTGTPVNIVAKNKRKDLIINQDPVLTSGLKQLNQK